MNLTVNVWGNQTKSHDLRLLMYTNCLFEMMTCGPSMVPVWFSLKEPSTSLTSNISSVCQINHVMYKKANHHTSSHCIRVSWTCNEKNLFFLLFFFIWNISPTLLKAWEPAFKMWMISEISHRRWSLKISSFHITTRVFLKKVQKVKTLSGHIVW